MRVDFAVNPHAAAGLLNDIADRGADMRPAMAVIRELLVEGHQRNFESHGAFLGVSWPALSPATEARKAREGLPAEPMVATGALLRALSGGTGARTRVTRTSASAGVSRDVYWAIFHLAGASRGRRGRLPARPVIGINEAQRETALSIMTRFLEYGSGLS